MLRSPRVVLVAPFGLRPKGTTIARVLPIGRELARQGATVRLAIPPWDDPRRAGERWWEDGVEMVHTSLGGALGPIGILQELYTLVREFQPSVVHAFKPIGYSGALAWGMARQRGPSAPLVVVDADDLEGPSGWAGRRQMRVSGPIRGIQERLTLQSAPRLTVASRWLEQHVRKMGVTAERVCYLPNGHDQVPWSVESPADGSFPLTILWYTRFTEASPARAANLFAPLLQADPELRLAVLGEEIASGARAALGAAFKQRGVGLQVEWLGYHPEGIERYLSQRRGRVVAAYPLDDDAVNRARCPSKVPQLMAMGIPVVAEAVGELPRYLAGFERECLVTPGHAGEFQARLTHWLDDPEGRLALGSALQTAADAWRWERTAAGLLDWYRDAPARPTIHTPGDISTVEI